MNFFKVSALIFCLSASSLFSCEHHNVIPPLCRQVDALQKFASETSDYAQESVIELRRQNEILKRELESAQHYSQELAFKMGSFCKETEINNVRLEKSVASLQRVQDQHTLGLNRLGDKSDRLERKQEKLKTDNQTNAQRIVELGAQNRGLCWTIGAGAVVTAGLSFATYLLYKQNKTLNDKHEALKNALPPVLSALAAIPFSYDQESQAFAFKAIRTDKSDPEYLNRITKSYAAIEETIGGFFLDKGVVYWRPNVDHEWIRALHQPVLK